MAYKRSRRDFESDVQKQQNPYVIYGTPLPPLDDQTRDDGSYVPVWKQEVTDDRGRKRLHGAFTGGFSAGYFNTVGSKEGWTPSTFVSSRKSRAKDAQAPTQQRPEDYMDEEDIREQEETRQLSTAGGFAGFGTEDDPNVQNTLMDLFKSSEDSMGMKLLNRMGWRQGQGIGPRVRRRADPDDETSEYHLFAPSDAPMLSFKRKSDHKGLGYEDAGGLSQEDPRSNHSSTLPPLGDESAEDRVSRPGFSFASQKKVAQKQTRSGFGVGILNDTGSDEEDPYSTGPRIYYNRSIGKEKKSKKKPESSTTGANPLLSSKPVFISKKLTTISNALRKCHDGRLPLPGFVLADELDGIAKLSVSDEKYKPPEVPSEWQPATLSKGVDGATSRYTSMSDAAKSSSHTVKSRAQMLGEASLPGKSIFDYLTPAARDRLAQATGKTNLPPALSEGITDHESGAAVEAPLLDLVPNLDASIALSALQRGLTGFMPYSEDIDKRQRYKAFLEHRAGTTTSIALPPRAPGASNEEWAIEMNEFARAAQVFKPITGLMATRFTSASNSSSTGPTSHTDPTTQDLLSKPTLKPEDPQESAARAGMFGMLTRTTTSFYPARLLCKRFGVSLPDHAMQPQTTSGNPSTNAPFPGPAEAQAHSKVHGSTDLLAIEAAPPPPPPASGMETDHIPSPSAAEIDPDKNDALEQQRPGEAVFKAIFGSEDEDEGDEDF